MNGIRDLTKSMTSYGWAMSVYGMQQMFNLMTPRKAAESFEKVTAATVNEMGQAMKDTFRVGDRIQRGMVDMMMGGLSMFGVDPSRWASNGAPTTQPGVGAAQGPGQAAGFATPGFQTAPPRSGGLTGRASEPSTNPPGSGPATASTSSAGWGPMPK